MSETVSQEELCVVKTGCAQWQCQLKSCVVDTGCVAKFSHDERHVVGGRSSPAFLPCCTLSP